MRFKFRYQFPSACLEITFQHNAHRWYAQSDFTKRFPYTLCYVKARPVEQQAFLEHYSTRLHNKRRRMPMASKFSTELLLVSFRLLDFFVFSKLSEQADFESVFQLLTRFLFETFKRLIEDNISSLSDCWHAIIALILSTPFILRFTRVFVTARPF